MHVCMLSGEEEEMVQSLETEPKTANPDIYHAGLSVISYKKEQPGYVDM